jgi:hypothetical protein
MVCAQGRAEVFDVAVLITGTEKPMEQLLALSIKQPYAEQILRGCKLREFRGRATNVRGKIYLYASRTNGPKEEFEKMGLKPGDLNTGVLVGTVNIVGCEKRKDYHGKYPYAWVLENPQRLAVQLKPEKPALPIWFHPF